MNLLVHSYLYYKLDSPIVTDHKWQDAANELAKLQQGRDCRIDCYDEAFEDWDASTGYHLPFDSWVIEKANYLLGLHKKKKSQPRRALITQRSLF